MGSAAAQAAGCRLQAAGCRPMPKATPPRGSLAPPPHCHFDVGFFLLSMHFHLSLVTCLQIICPLLDAGLPFSPEPSSCPSLVWPESNLQTHDTKSGRTRGDGGREGVRAGPGPSLPDVVVVPAGDISTPFKKKNQTFKIRAVKKVTFTGRVDKS